MTKLTRDERRENKRGETAYLVNPATIPLFATLAKASDNVPVSPGQEICVPEFEKYDISMVCISVYLFHNQRCVPDPSDLRNNAVITRVSVIPVEGHNIVRYGAPQTGIVWQIITKVEDVHGDKRVVVSRLGVLHRHILCVWDDSSRVHRGVVNREREFWNCCLVKCEICDFTRVWWPPDSESIIGWEDLLFIHPVRDSMEERRVAGWCNANRAGIRSKKCQPPKTVQRQMSTYSAEGRIYRSFSVTYAIAFPVGTQVAYAVIDGLEGGIIGCVVFCAMLCT